MMPLRLPSWWVTLGRSPNLCHYLYNLNFGDFFKSGLSKVKHGSTLMHSFNR